MELIFATHNANKAQEIRSKFPINFKTLSEIGYLEEVPENGNTFHENALQKATWIHQQLLKPVFAEDSGLEIDTLANEPGVYSARYAGEEKNNQANIQKVLQKMHRQNNRTARFKTVICLIIKNEKMFFEGIIHGTITKEERGNHGFGYDAIFIPENKTRTFAEMEASEKIQLSHRSQAMQSMIDFLCKLKK